MAVKYQVSLCLRPDEILLVTFNHLDTIRNLIKDSPKISEQLQQLYNYFNKVGLSIKHCQLLTGKIHILVYVHIYLSMYTCVCPYTTY